MPHYCPKAGRNPLQLPKSCSNRSNLLTLSLLPAAILVLSACSGRMDTPNNLGKLSQRSDIGPGGAPSEESASRLAMATKMDMGAEEAISNGCLSAWRKACAGDEKGAMSELNALDKTYPKFLTIQMMMGQVLDHFGKTEEAIEHYRKAAVGDEFSFLREFKLAQAYRKAHRYDEAVPIFRKLVAGSPDFAPSLVGLADCLAQKPATIEEARGFAEQAIKLAPEDKEAQALVKRLSKR